MPGEYRADIIGQRLGVDETAVAGIVLLAQRHQIELPKFNSKCLWAKDKTEFEPRAKLEGAPLLTRSNCAYYVEYLYEIAGLDIVDQVYTSNPVNPGWLDPATQAHAFWRGEYPLRVRPWVPWLGEYDGNPRGKRSTKR